MRNQSLAVAIVIVTGAVAEAQNRSQPAFRSEINLVRLAVRVVDDKGIPVKGLVEADFEVFENGKLQQIATFSGAGITAPLQHMTVGAPSSGSAELPGQGADHVYLIVVDDYHLTPLEVIRSKQILGDFLERRLGPNDLTAIVVASGGGQDFTTDRNLVLAALANLRASPLRPQRPDEMQVRAISLLKTIADASNWLTYDAARRKVLILVSSEVGCNVIGRGGCGRDVRDTVEVARNAEVSIYPLHPRGLSAPGFAPAEVGGGIPVPNSEPARGAIAAPSRNLRTGPMSALNVLAVDTGGFMITDTNRFDQELDRVVEDNSTYYLIGYYSTDENQIGKPRRVNVKVKRKDVRAFYRQTISPVLTRNP